VLLRGVSHTLGFEDCLTVAPPEAELEVGHAVQADPWLESAPGCPTLAPVK
jgi:hypothetical protein